MNKEQIEQVARGYAEENSWYPGETSYESDIRAMEESFADAFKAGADWRIKSVWHDRSEKPCKSPRDLFLYYANGIRLITYYGEDWELVIDVDKFVKWAYVEDLLP